jgi:hypothetical protein
MVHVGVLGGVGVDGASARIWRCSRPNRFISSYCPHKMAEDNEGFWRLTCTMRVGYYHLVHLVI